MTRRNRVDPWGDLHDASPRGLFTGNRGCLVDDAGRLVRHHSGQLWITCRTEYRGWKHPLDTPNTWTPLFFLDEAVALAASHRPCGLCRRADYLAYREAVAKASATGRAVLAPELNRRLSLERYRHGRGLVRAQDRAVWASKIESLPVGTVIVDPVTGGTQLLTKGHQQAFKFDGWGPAVDRQTGITVTVLTPPTSVGALKNGFEPCLHSSAEGSIPTVVPD